MVSSRPPKAGPTKKARLSIVLEVPFAAVSSSGVLTRFGSSAATAGRKGAATRAVHVARTNTTITGASRQIRTAAARTRPPRMRSLVTITRLRGKRSANVEAKGVTTAMRISRTVPQMPTAATPPTL